MSQGHARKAEDAGSAGGLSLSPINPKVPALKRQRNLSIPPLELVADTRDLCLGQGALPSNPKPLVQGGAKRFGDLKCRAPGRGFRAF